MNEENGSTHFSCGVCLPWNSGIRLLWGREKPFLPSAPVERPCVHLVNTSRDICIFRNLWPVSAEVPGKLTHLRQARGAPPDACASVSQTVLRPLPCTAHRKARR